MFPYVFRVSPVFSSGNREIRERRDDPEWTAAPIQYPGLLDDPQLVIACINHE